MNYWFTTHWPPLRGETRDPERGVWGKDGHLHLIQRLAPGDLVAIYEARSGDDVMRRRPDGTTERIKRLQGRAGVVALARVVGGIFEEPKAFDDYYESRPGLCWRFFARTCELNSAGFVPRDQVNAMLGYDVAYNFRGFGEQRSGIKQLHPDTFEQIRRAFLAYTASDDRHRATTASRSGGCGGGGEGPVHQKLKERIAADPAGVLGEPGLTHFATEFAFGATGDRIDVVLQDRYGRFVAVEVEPDCDQFHKAGPLQCMKYRAMLAYWFERRLGEVRCILAAPSIHPVVSARCEPYGVETCVVEPTGSAVAAATQAG